MLRMHNALLESDQQWKLIPHFQIFIISYIHFLRNFFGPKIENSFLDGAKSRDNKAFVHLP